MILSDAEIAFHLGLSRAGLLMLRSLIEREAQFGRFTGHTEEAGPVAASLCRLGYAEELPRKGRSSLRYRLNDVGRDAIRVACEKHGRPNG